MTALLLALKPYWGRIAVSTALLMVGFGLGYHLGRPKTPETVQQAQNDVHMAHDTLLRIDTLVHRVTQTLTKTIAHYDTVRDSIHDTLPPIHDTMWVKQEVQACDSLRASCGAFQVAAHQKFHADSLLIGALGRENDAWKASQPSFGSTLKLTLLGAAAGILADRIAVHNHH